MIMYLAEWASDPMIYENAWKGAEAYHYYMLAQEQLYSGKLHDALCTAYKLQDYVNYISPEEVYSLLALTSCLDRSFGICSKALIKLKTLPEVSHLLPITTQLINKYLNSNYFYS
jgi:WD repeat-containing protein 35